MVQKGSAMFLRTCSERRADCATTGRAGSYHHSIAPTGHTSNAHPGHGQAGCGYYSMGEGHITQTHMCWDTHFSYLSGPPSTLPHTKTSTSDSTPVLRKLISTYSTKVPRTRPCKTLVQHQTIYFVWKMWPDKGFYVLGTNTQQTVCYFKVKAETFRLGVHSKESYPPGVKWVQYNMMSLNPSDLLPPPGIDKFSLWIWGLDTGTASQGIIFTVIKGLRQNYFNSLQHL